VRGRGSGKYVLVENFRCASILLFQYHYLSMYLRYSNLMHHVNLGGGSECRNWEVLRDRGT
jgi:hypothetical protein